MVDIAYISVLLYEGFSLCITGETLFHNAAIALHKKNLNKWRGIEVLRFMETCQIFQRSVYCWF